MKAIPNEAPIRPLRKPSRSRHDLDRLAHCLASRFKALRQTQTRPAILAAGITRLGQIERLEFISPRHRSLPESLRSRAEESLLIRIRQERYSAAAWLIAGNAQTESKIRIHAEHQSRLAIAFQALARYKRPRTLTVGRLEPLLAACRWFRID